MVKISSVKILNAKISNANIICNYNMHDDIGYRFLYDKIINKIYDI